MVLFESQDFDGHTFAHFFVWGPEVQNEKNPNKHRISFMALARM